MNTGNSQRRSAGQCPRGDNGAELTVPPVLFTAGANISVEVCASRCQIFAANAFCP